MIAIDCDVLVVGGGAGGAWAALAALAGGASVCLAVKGRFAAVGARGAGASACGATEKGGPRLANDREAGFDSQLWYDRIRCAGLGLADPKLAAVLSEGIEAAAADCRRRGIRFDQVGGESLGVPIVQGAEETLRKCVRLCEGILVADLVVEDGRCTGAVGLNRDAETVVFHAGATVLATGGAARLYRHNVHPSCVTGDGYAMAFRAGAHLINLEFMQFFLCTPIPTRNLFHLRRVRTLDGLVNARNEHFLQRYLPGDVTEADCLAQNLRHGPFSTRDRASRYLGVAIVKEVAAGRGAPHGGVFLDLGEDAAAMNPIQRAFLCSRGIDPAREPVAVTMGFQCSNGGVRIDADGMSTVPGLFAVGEAAGGIHGADRIGGTMLAACLVFGERTGRAAARWAGAHRGGRGDTAAAGRAMATLRNVAPGRGKTSPDTLAAVLGDMAWRHGLTVRSETGLVEWLAGIRSLEAQCERDLAAATPPARIRSLELRNLLLVGEMVATAALHRCESRGGHYREDCPECRSDLPVRGLEIFRGPRAEVAIRETVVDPGWTDRVGDLDLQRWG